jgi:hypothetical protein
MTSVTVEMQWPEKLGAEVDLWVQALAHVPVGYSNKSGRVFDRRATT